MKIVILDGFTLNPGDLDWSPLKRFGHVEIYDRTPGHLVLERAAGAEIIFTNKTPLREDTLSQLPQLKYIGVLATGYDVVDITAARRMSISVTNVPGYGPDSVAQMVFSHILNITNNVNLHCRDVEKGGWQKQEDFCYLLSPQIEISKKTMGIIGYGEIGRATARIARAFNMRVLVHTRTEPRSLPENVSCVDLETLLSKSDIVSLHCPLTDSTRHLINSDRLKLMKRTSILINCSRGPLVNEQDLAGALEKGDIAAAGLDVLMVEPPSRENPLIGARNCNITPHIAWATREARTRLLQIAVGNLHSYLQGSAENVVN